MGFDTNTRGRSWVITFQIQNMKNAGWNESDYMQPEILSERLIELWSQSGANRTCGVVVCKSAAGLYHAHIAAYGNTTTLKNVSKIFFDAHTEPQIGGKAELCGYLRKEGRYEEKGEVVLFEQNLEAIEDNKGKRTDIDRIKELLDLGWTPSQIMDADIHFRLYEKIIRGEFFSKRKKSIPIHREVKVYWHTGESGTGKSFIFVKLVEKYGENEVYMMTDYESGGLDKYCGEKVLIMDEFKGDMSFQKLLNYLEGYKIQIHCRYQNAYALWSEVHITSIYPPEEIYEKMVDFSHRSTDSLLQLKRRITSVIFHYKKDGEFRTFELSGTEYINYANLKQRIFGDKNGFIPLLPNESDPFDKNSKKELPSNISLFKRPSV